jgi:acetyl esterase/lipase
VPEYAIHSRSPTVAFSETGSVFFSAGTDLTIGLAPGHAWVSAAQSKSRRPIAVPLNATAVKVLRRQLGKHSERVFTCRGRPISWANTLAWRNALKRAGIPAELHVYATGDHDFGVRQN